jgi:hypothetical protein
MPAPLAPNVSSVVAGPCIAEPIAVRAKFFFESDDKWFLKGTTYGPFKPNEQGDLISTPERARNGLRADARNGAEPHSPLSCSAAVAPRPCGEHGLRALISIPWTQHVEFLNSRRLRARVLLRNPFGGHAASRPSGSFRLSGRKRSPDDDCSMARCIACPRVLEKLIAVGRETDPRALFSYASYPPTEYLLPANVDFLTFNVYLEAAR